MTSDIELALYLWARQLQRRIFREWKAVIYSERFRNQVLVKAGWKGFRQNHDLKSKQKVVTEVIAGLRAKHGIQKLCENVLRRRRKEVEKEERLMEQEADKLLFKNFTKKATDSWLVYCVERKKKALIVNVGKKHLNRLRIHNTLSFWNGWSSSKRIQRKGCDRLVQRRFHFLVSTEIFPAWRGYLHHRREKKARQTEAFEAYLTEQRKTAAREVAEKSYTELRKNQSIAKEAGWERFQVLHPTFDSWRKWTKKGANKWIEREMLRMGIISKPNLDPQMSNVYLTDATSGNLHRNGNNDLANSITVTPGQIRRDTTDPRPTTTNSDLNGIRADSTRYLNSVVDMVKTSATGGIRHTATADFQRLRHAIGYAQDVPDSSPSVSSVAVLNHPYEAPYQEPGSSPGPPNIVGNDIPVQQNLVERKQEKKGHEKRSDFGNRSDLGQRSDHRHDTGTPSTVFPDHYHASSPLMSVISESVEEAISIEDHGEEQALSSVLYYSPSSAKATNYSASNYSVPSDMVVCEPLQTKSVAQMQTNPNKQRPWNASGAHQEPILLTSPGFPRKKIWTEPKLRPAPRVPPGMVLLD